MQVHLFEDQNVLWPWLSTEHERASDDRVISPIVVGGQGRICRPRGLSDLILPCPQNLDSTAFCHQIIAEGKPYNYTELVSTNLDDTMQQIPWLLPMQVFQVRKILIPIAETLSGNTTEILIWRYNSFLSLYRPLASLWRHSMCVFFSYYLHLWNFEALMGINQGRACNDSGLRVKPTYRTDEDAVLEGCY